MSTDFDNALSGLMTVPERLHGNWKRPHSVVSEQLLLGTANYLIYNIFMILDQISRHMRWVRFRCMPISICIWDKIRP